MKIKNGFTVLVFLIFTGMQHAAAHVRHKNIIQKTSDDTCLADAIYYESGHEPDLGKQAVGEVILNRQAIHFGSESNNSICSIIHQKYNGICQFGFACRQQSLKNAALYMKCHEIAQKLLNSQIPKILPDKVLFFNSLHGRKFNSKHFRTYRVIGQQIFYIPVSR
jgi:spore germination cell wall hydrolase CwlJ-like protein